MVAWLCLAAGCGRLGYTTIDTELADASGNVGGNAGSGTGGSAVGTDAAGGSAGGTGGTGGGGSGGATGGGAGGMGGSPLGGNVMAGMGGSGMAGSGGSGMAGTGGSGMAGTGGSGVAGTGGSTTPDAKVDSPPDLPPDSAPAGSGITLTATSATARRGTTAGGAGQLIASCPGDQVVIGFEGFQGRNQMYPWLQSAGGVCGTVSINGLAVTITEAGKLAVFGATNGAAWTRRCPQNQVVIGFDGNSGDWMGVIKFRCAPLVVSGSGTITIGAVTTLDPVGGAADNTFPTTDCASGQVARGQDITAGTWMSAFGLLCATPQRR
jgi:hypothetical protein